jgi:hypothetical protein
VDPFAVPIAFFVSVAFTVVGVSFSRAIGRRMDARNMGSGNAEILSRLERMEQAIDAIAVEVERVSEAQRFTTKLLSEKAGIAGRLGGGQ